MNLVLKSRQSINENNDYVAGYDYAVQAKYFAEELAREKLLVECDMLRGLAYLGIDKMTGHEILFTTYLKSERGLRLDSKLKVRLEKAIGEYDEAMDYLCRVMEISQKQIDLHKDNENESHHEWKYWITYSLIYLSVILLLKYKQSLYPTQIERVEKRIKEKNLTTKEEITAELNAVYMTSEIHHELVKAEEYIKEAQRMAKESEFGELEIVTKINMACILLNVRLFNPTKLKLFEPNLPHKTLVFCELK